MKDIKNAILAEQEYLKNKSEMSLHDRLKPFGYMGLGQYFNDKRDYLFSNAVLDKVQDVTSEEAYKLFFENYEQGKYAMICPTDSHISACTGSDAIDKQFANSLNISLYPMGYIGGTVVYSPDDVVMGITFPKEVDSNDFYFLYKFQQFIKNKTGLITEITSNDLLLDGKKVLGCAGYCNDKCRAFFFIMSLTDTSKYINQICILNANKPAGYIPGLTKQEVIDEVFSWAKSSI